MTSWTCLEPQLGSGYWASKRCRRSMVGALGARKGRGCQSGPSWEGHEAWRQASISASIALNVEHLRLAGKRRGGEGEVGSAPPTPRPLQG